MIFKEWYGLIFCWVPSKFQPLYHPANALYWCTETWLNVFTGDSVLHPPLLVPTGSQVTLESTCVSGVKVCPGCSSLDQDPFNLTGLFLLELNYHLQDWRPLQLEALSSIVGISQSTDMSSPNPIPGALMLGWPMEACILSSKAYKSISHSIVSSTLSSRNESYAHC